MGVTLIIVMLLGFLVIDFFVFYIVADHVEDGCCMIIIVLFDACASRYLG